MAANRASSVSSFVTDVLQTAGHLEKDDISATLEKLSQRIEEVKVQMYDALQKKYVDFYPNLNTALELHTRVESLSEDMEALSNKIEGEIKGQLNISTAEFEDLAEQLEESKLVLKILEKLLNINTALKATESALKTQDYLSAVASLAEMDKWMAMSVHQREGEVKALAALQNHCQLQRQNLEHSIAEAWSEAVKWDVPPEPENCPKEYRAELSLASGDKARVVLAKAIQAMHGLDLLEPKIRILGERFFEYLVQPIVKCTATKVNVASDLRANSLTVTYKLQKGKADEPVPPQEVFSKLSKVLSFLQKSILMLEIKPVEMEGETAEDRGRTPLMQTFGELISSKCLGFIIENCLAHSIPTSNKDLENYTAVINTIKVFQTDLAEIGFIKEDDSTLSDFAGSVNVLFANKKTQEVLEKARVLMTSELHNTVKITNDRPFGEMAALGLEGSSAKKAKTAENIVLSSGAKLSASTFRLPDCHISVSMERVVQLCYETLHEATTSKPQCAILLFYAVRYVFELFCNVVPTYHKNSLTELPQLAALHHNNCMYLAHHLMTLGHQFRPRLPEPLSQGVATFVDLVPKLRRLGTQCFMEQMLRQKSQLLEYLASAQGLQGMGEHENEQRGQQAVKQALHQLQHLANVWYAVLPQNVFCKSIGTLLNSVLVEIIGCITSLEDISEDDGGQLHSLLTLLADRSPKLYTEAAAAADTTPKALLLKHVAKWNKLQELKLLLNASLQDISDRWAEGKGPLAHEFQPNEVKQMIRAMFQNTDRRANVLSKIR